VPYSQVVADEVFDTFVRDVASAERPLYFHTDDRSLRKMFKYLEQFNGNVQPTVMPFTVRPVTE
jgi:hypothetical protein